MPSDTTIVFGIPVPSADPVFLAVVRFHILVGIVCVVAGVVAMLSSKGRGPAFDVWNALLLVLSNRCRFSDRPVRGALGGELSPVLSWGVFLDSSDRRAHGSSAALAQLRKAPHHRRGFVLHSDADRVLRGQRQEPAALERASSNCLLVVACWAGHTAHCAYFAEASAGTPRKASHLN
jgi:hypothetical protein